MDGQAPIEGWYTDPVDPSRYRYWDGAGWTPLVRTSGSTTPSPAPEPAPVVEPEPIAATDPIVEPEPIAATDPIVEPEPIAATDPAIDALFADPDPEPTDETPARRAPRGGARQHLVVTVAVIGLAAVGLTAALTFIPGDGSADESSADESSEAFDTAAARHTCIARLRAEVPGNESEVEWQPADAVEHQQVGNQVHVEFWGHDPDEEPGLRRANFLCVLDGGDLSSVERLYMRFDDLPLEESGSVEFESVGASSSD